MNCQVGGLICSKFLLLIPIDWPMRTSQSVSPALSTNSLFKPPLLLLLLLLDHLSSVRVVVVPLSLDLAAASLSLHQPTIPTLPSIQCNANYSTLPNQSLATIQLIIRHSPLTSHLSPLASFALTYTCTCTHQQQQQHQHSQS